MTPLATAIADVYAQVGAPDWAAPNLDGLADVLRDLSWLPEGDVYLGVPDLAALADVDTDRLLAVLRRAEIENAEGPHPVRLTS